LRGSSTWALLGLPWGGWNQYRRCSTGRLLVVAALGVVLTFSLAVASVAAYRHLHGYRLRGHVPGSVWRGNEDYRNAEIGALAWCVLACFLRPHQLPPDIPRRRDEQWRVVLGMLAGTWQVGAVVGASAIAFGYGWGAQSGLFVMTLVPGVGIIAVAVWAIGYQGNYERAMIAPDHEWLTARASRKRFLAGLVAFVILRLLAWVFFY